MALKFLNKKGWHTGSLRNLETVWKAEQKHEAEQKKLEELRAQLHKEREAEELRHLHEEAGLAPRQERLEFLYDSAIGFGGGASKSGDGASSSKPSTTDNPGRPLLESGRKEDGKNAVPGALFEDSNPQSANDKWRKIHSDPLYLIRQQELAALEKIRKNPVKMQMLESQVRQKLSVDGQVEKSERRHRKERKHDRKKDRESRHHRKKRHERKEDSESRHHSKSRHDREEDRHRKERKYDRHERSNGREVDKVSSGRKRRDRSSSPWEDSRNSRRKELA